MRLSADTQLVCVHDAAVPGLGPVTALDVGALADADAARVLTFATFLDDLDAADPGRRSVVHLDLKARGYELAAVDAVLAHGRPLFVTTSEGASIATVRSARPDVPAYLTIGRSRHCLSWRAAVALRLGELVPMRAILRSRATGVAVHHALLTAPLRWWCRRRGLAMVVWTVDDDARLRTWLSRTVDVVTTNRPRAALALREG